LAAVGFKGWKIQVKGRWRCFLLCREACQRNRSIYFFYFSCIL